MNYYISIYKQESVGLDKIFNDDVQAPSYFIKTYLDDSDIAVAKIVPINIDSKRDDEYDFYRSSREGLEAV